MYRFVAYFFAISCVICCVAAFSEEQDEQDLIHTSPDLVAALCENNDFLAGGVVSPISGQLCMRHVDLVAKGAQDVVMFRTYLAPFIPSSFHSDRKRDECYLSKHLRSTYQGWVFLPHWRLQVFTLKSKYVVRFTQPSGITLDFRLSGPQYSITSFDDVPYGISNVCGVHPGGQYDPRNTRIAIQNNWRQIIVHVSDGTIAHYRTEDPSKNSFPSRFYLLEKEVLPNGKVLKYYFDSDKRLSRIDSLDPRERVVYASVRIEGAPGKGARVFKTNTGLVAKYRYLIKTNQIQFRDKHYRLTYTVTMPPLLKEVDSPLCHGETLDYASRYFLQSYCRKGDRIACAYATCKEPRGGGHQRVSSLSFPVGLNDELQPVYKLSYELPLCGEKQGSTTVTNIDGTKVIHRFSKEFLRTAIQHYGQDGLLKKQKIFKWDDNNRLSSIEIADGNDHRLLRTSYSYDSFGNPVVETVTGGLTGNGGEETYTIRREFSRDGRHLLLREEYEEGKVICYRYLPETNLITAKFTKKGPNILQREFFEYDDCNNLVVEIKDDGVNEDCHELSSVTERIVRRYLLKREQPFLHMREWIEDRYLDNGEEKLLKRAHLFYDTRGNVRQEDIYDADDQFVYSIFKEFNDGGDLLSETNPLGQRALYSYDDRGYRVSETSFSGERTKFMSYDAHGRLQEEKEVGADGTIHRVLYKYDYNDRVIQKVDQFNNATRYDYDLIVNRVTKTEMPAIVNAEGLPTPVNTMSAYDAFGREISQVDANGNVTTTRYNAHGLPIEKVYADGSKEIFRYTKNRELKKYVDQEGCAVVYSYDVLGRIVAKEYLAADGKAVASESFSYNSFHLVEHVDKEGHSTQYSYDGAGRKVRETRCEMVKEFVYDALNRNCTVIEHNENNTLVTNYARDLMNRVTEKTKCNRDGDLLYRISYSYDDDGSLRSTTRYVNGEESTQRFSHDSFGRLTERCDACGYTSEISYDEGVTNALGQQVLQTMEVDPTGIVTIETKEAYNRVVKKEMLSSCGTTLSCQELSYDPCGNLIEQRDHVYGSGTYFRTHVLKKCYTCRNQLESFTRAFGTPDARTTQMRYTADGKVASKILPDGTVLFYCYDALGFLRTLKSSDERIHHRFEHNRNGVLVRAFDEGQKIAIEREVDPFGCVLRESISTGSSVVKNYDAFGRPLIVQIGNEGTIVYDYDALYLRAVSRRSSAGELVYSHHYDGYDLDGNLLSESLAGGGDIVSGYDAEGRLIRVAGPHFSEEYVYDSRGDLIHKVTDGEQHDYAYDGLSQLTSEEGGCVSSTYCWDSVYNCTAKDGREVLLNDLNELLILGATKCAYDGNGNMVCKETLAGTLHLSYDPLNRLTEAIREEAPKERIRFTYDPLGRRLSKAVDKAVDEQWVEESRERYIYDEEQEIGTMKADDSVKELRSLGQGQRTVGIELEGKAFAALCDGQSNVRGLVDIASGCLSRRYEFTAFGEDRSRLEGERGLFNPWMYASKRLDPHLNLIDFGKRFYDPEMGRWVTTDPVGFIDGINLYQYCLNNPFHYVDSNGKFVMVLPLLTYAFGGTAAFITMETLVSVAITAAVAWGANELITAFDTYVNDRLDRSALRDDQILPNACHARGKKKGNDNNIAPDLPADPHNDPNLEDISHPEEKANGHYTFRDTRNGKIIRYDEGKPGKSGHGAHDHYHKLNPKTAGNRDEYLDAKGNPVGRHSNESHLYPPEWVWWH